MRYALAVAALLAATAGAAAQPATPTLAFREQRIPAGGTTPFGVAISDLDRDGRLDLAITNAGSNDVAILLAAGDAFRLAGRIALGATARGIAAADLGGDDVPDLVLAALDNRVVVIRGDGHGGGTPQRFAAGLAPFQVAIADLTADGHADVAVADESNIAAYEGRGEVSILLGDGRGGLTPAPALHADTNPSDVAAGDLDGDGRLDLAVSNWGSRTLSLFRNQGAPSGAGLPPRPAAGSTLFAAPRTMAYGGAPAYAVAVGDVGGDGRADLVVGDAQGVVHLLINQGDLAFTPATPLRAGAGMRSLVLADLDSDRRLDVATANTGDDSVSVFLRRADGWAPAQRIAVGSHPRTVRAADLDGNGRVDLVVTNGGSNDVSVLRQEKDD